MTLLTEVMENPLDPSYAAAAARREAQALQGRGAKRRPTMGVIVGLLSLAVGLITTVATVQLRVPQPGAGQARAALERQISYLTEQLTDNGLAAEELTAEIDELQRHALDAHQPELLEQIRLDAVHNGSEAVVGPGLVISLSNATGTMTGEADPNSLVRDEDLRRVVTILWAAGAEAIAIDEQRLTPTSSIRNVGTTVLVNLVPLPGPAYVVRAIGDAERMQAQIAASDLPDFLHELGVSWGIRSSTVAQSRLELPGAGARSLQYAEVQPESSLGWAP